MKSNIVYIVVGPTASGKSGLALDLAKHLNGTIINADSMQIYASLSILTARPTGADIKKAPHFLYGILENPNENYSVSKWRDMAIKEVRSAFESEKVPIVAGGTGLYIKAFLEGLSEIPEIDTTIREKLRTTAQSQDGLSLLYEDLQKYDPIAAKHLKQNDIQRIIRALEVVISTGKPIHEWQKIPLKPLPYQTKIIYLSPTREEVVAKSYNHLKIMFEQGAIEEVKNLIDKGLSSESPLRKAVGVREIEAYLKNDLSLESALERSFIATRQYIKRQQTWFNNQVKADIILNHCYTSSDFQKICGK